MFRASSLPNHLSLPFVDRAEHDKHIYIPPRLPAFCFRFSLPSSRAFFREFFRGRIDTNCKTLSGTVLPTDSSRRRRFFLAPVVVAVHSWKRTLPSWPRFRVMFVCSFPFPLRALRRKFSQERKEKLFLVIFCTRCEMTRVAKIDKQMLTEDGIV